MMKSVLISGTSSGLGKLATELLAAKGYRVFAAMRETGGKNAIVAAQLAALPNVTVVDFEATDTASINRAVAAVIAGAGRLDVLINNSGFFALGIAESFSGDDLRHIHDVNVVGPWRFIRAALPHMRHERDGL